MIQISLQTEIEKVKLRVGDNGVGLPKENDFRQMKSLGLQLVNLLVEHDLRGSINHENKVGTQYYIQFPIL